MASEQIVKEAACQEEGRTISKVGYLAIGTWLDLVQVQTMPNAKYQEPVF
jgi:hypothetical protein